MLKLVDSRHVSGKDRTIRYPMSMNPTALRDWASHASATEKLKVAALAVVIAAAIVLSAILQGDVPDVVAGGTAWFRIVLHRYTYLASYGLLYIEESGVPLPAPGDVFVMYVGAHVPRNLPSWIIAWLGLIGIVVLGATNLFFISKRIGRRLAEGRFAEVVHLSPQRLQRAEQWFQKYGVVAIIFGRHIPGFRIPITVAAGVLKVKYRVFAASVAVSTAMWAGVVIVIGINFGPRMEAFLRVHRETYWMWAAIVLVMVIVIVLRVYRSGPHPTQSSSSA
jgi:membrane protein DedA with SNARE-associated domain